MIGSGLLERIKNRNKNNSGDLFDFKYCEGNLGIDELEKILQWKLPEGSHSFFVVNPYKIVNRVPTMGDLNENFYWAAHFNRNESHEIAFLISPEYHFRQLGELLGGEKVQIISRDFKFWNDCGHFDYQKHAQRRPLVSNVSSQELIALVDSLYGTKLEK